MIARGQRGDGDGKEVGVAIEGKHEGSLWMEIFSILTVSMSVS